MRLRDPFSAREQTRVERIRIIYVSHVSFVNIKLKLFSKYESWKICTFYYYFVKWTEN